MVSLVRPELRVNYGRYFLAIYIKSNILVYKSLLQ